MEKKEYLDIAIHAAEEAGNILMNYYGHVEMKSKDGAFGGASILTQADIESEKKIVEILKKHVPEHNIFAEEETQEHNNSEYTWYIDPLDGTSNFSRNIPLFGISIGLIKGVESILGVLYFPALDLLVKAEQGKGAFANDKQIHVSQRALKQSLYYSGGYYKGEMQLEQQVADAMGIVKIIDASSYEFAQIAMGDAELYILNSVPHDVVAGVIIVQEAGGKVTDYNNKAWTIDSEKIVASNGVIHDEVIKRLYA